MADQGGVGPVVRAAVARAAVWQGGQLGARPDRTGAHAEKAMVSSDPGPSPGAGMLMALAARSSELPRADV